MHFIGHFKTITRHKILVAKGCFKLGLYYQGIMHDMSKYSPTEFLVGVKYYQGTESPNNAERMEEGISMSWLHHKGRNRHHYEYWVDYSTQSIEGGMAPVTMPRKYVAEMLMDRIAASKTYRGSAYKDSDPLAYYKNAKEPPFMHIQTRRQLEHLLTMLAEEGEEKTFAYVRRILKKGRRADRHSS